MINPPHSGIVVVGSANMDVVFSVERIPVPGETLIADSVAKYPGGKGLNQAVAAARSGGDTVFVGALGADENGDELFATMSDSGIDSTLVRRVDVESGQAFIVVADSAENTIIVASGANAEVMALTAEERDRVTSSAVLLAQLELPLEVVIESAREARAAGTTVMLNAAPARALPDELIDILDYLIVNEHEACLLGGSDDLAEASVRLAARVPQVIVTLGAEGSVLYQGGRELARVPARRVMAIDTTGAGDTYCGAFATAIAAGRGLTDAAAFATAASALSVQKLGAVPSIPARDRIDAMLGEPL
ncbi:ribokinase [Cryobacterium mesophilum]|uniref:Ribokinase n=1 Tax=Terrimesophilobacter mesophilus TaxID=433647 RepID=A0A4R8V8D1_9MICO|nr:ribokinase [Terrimesophilobacter mesophilus]MBB5634112.1 ribokinase [Terrimesophilobacter mesophilus]TFB78695.1 ribokinase [Terrimesophilobacter mesophilus]